MNEEPSINSERKKSCTQCGAELTYEPGTSLITCEYCDYKETIELSDQPFQELNLNKYLNQVGSHSHSMEISMLHCNNCGANQHVEDSYKSLNCVYCTMPLIIEDSYKEEWILPGAIIPFEFKPNKAQQIFKKWIADLWWAPNNLQRASINPENTKGLYVPYWTFDANLFAKYDGERGEYYYVTVTRGSGEDSYEAEERRTSWHSVDGTVSGFIDDTLVKASVQKGSEIPTKIAFWELDKLKNFDTRFLAGYVTEKYTIPLKEGHLDAQIHAKYIAERWAKKDIGGDEQRVHQLEIQLSQETFKHVLLPVYISSYTFKNKSYKFYVNGQTGTIHGTRPYSFWKIFLASLATIILIFGIIYYFYTDEVNEFFFSIRIEYIKL